MLYPKSRQGTLTPADFATPSSEYRAAPFWAWNCALQREDLFRQIDVMRRMGMGGFHMHTRVGMRTPYLSDRFLELIEACAGEAERLGMLAYLYDEDKWPSGYAGGMVTRDPKFRQRYLCFTPDPEHAIGASNAGSAIAQAGTGQGALPRRLLGVYSIHLDKEGCLALYERLEPAAIQGDNIWYAYLGVCECNDWFNGYSYVNTLSKEAIEKFVETTHERYWERVGDQFGRSIPAIFTDEPQAFQKQRLPSSDFHHPLYITFTDDLDDTFRETYGYSLLDRLPELFWDLPGNALSQARYHYHDHVTERFASAYADTLGDWCEGHGLLLTGHMMEEPTLRSQTNMIGEAMRSYRSFGLPGIDLLCDARELNTAKQCQSAAHQYGREGALSELYGVTGWDFPFRDHKLQGDWQAALGITLRVPHLYWVSMEGEAKRDYPASIGHQSPWYKEYPLVEDHFARLNTALTRGRPRVRLGVVHPVESYWLHYGPLDRAQKSESIERHFAELTEWLLFGLVDFDFICESLLPSQYRESGDGKLHVGEMAYDAVLVPGCDTLRSTTLDALEQFADHGGRVIFAGEPPCAADALLSGRPCALAERCEQIPFEHKALLNALEPVRELDIRTPQGTRSDNLLSQMRDDGEGRWLFVCHCFPPSTPDDPPQEHYTISLRGSWSATWYDTLTGRILPLDSCRCHGVTQLEWHCDCHDSLLLRLEKADGQTAAAPETDRIILPTRARTVSKAVRPLCREDEAVPVTLDEPNALLLDRAEWRLDNGAWRPKEDILRIDCLVRDALGLPRRCNSAAQPWLWPEDSATHTLSLRMIIASELPVTGARLAIEHPEQAEIRLGNKQVESIPDGWYVDEAIQTVPLPPVPAGETELLITLPFGIQTAVEWCYLLGDFGVALSGADARLTLPVRALRFGDIVPQGLPFYTGNLTYHCSLSADKGSCRLRVPAFRSPVLGISLDGRDAGRIAFAPYQLALGIPEAGSHALDITVFGNRHNGFGPIHQTGALSGGYGPGNWFTEGETRAQEYVLRPNGILTPPLLEVF